MGGRALVLACLAPAAVFAAGCGVGSGSSPQGAQLVITQDFGARPVAQPSAPRIGGSDTVMRFLERNARVSTRYGGGFVHSIEGLAGDSGGARPIDWFYYVNGVEADKGATSKALRRGDVVWWDRHDWGAAMRVPAVVGSFPAPFRYGIDGKKLPVRVECTAPQSAACDAVQKRMTDAGVLAAKGGLQRSFTKETLRIVVGPYAAIRADDAVRQLEKGPQVSGVYARPSPDGRALALLDARGRVTRRLGAGAGLVAATRFQDARPVWIVTGVGDAGVDAAAGALDEGNLKNRFALAVDAGQGRPVPEVAGGR